MRPPSRFLAPVLSTALIALSFASAAAAEGPEASEGNAPATTQVVDFDAAFASAAARMDEQMNVALSSTTTMDCRHDAELGYETCTVTLEPVDAHEAPLASN
jgi:hypothetical protein